jgi:DNA-binding transcriptional MerR regulator
LSIEVARMSDLTIGQLTKQAQVNVEAIRYDERRGLLPTSPRCEPGYRQYTLQDVAYLQFIRRAKRRHGAPARGFALERMAATKRQQPRLSCLHSRRAD